MAFCRISFLLFTCLFGLAILQTSRAQDSQQDYLNAHNSARAAVGVEALVWDNEVAAYAQNYSNQRKNDCSREHSFGPYGENIAWSGRDELSGSRAVTLWVGEKADYDYNSNTCRRGKACGHYTQVVWRDSVRVGCAKVRCNDNKGTFIICNYDPPGNYDGESPY